MYDTAVRHTNNAAEVAVSAAGLGKRYGEFWALRDLDMEVRAGTVLGLLGHNGAGKTTTVRILATLAEPTIGRATVAGHDVVRDAARVRSRIGLAGQATAVDDLLTARVNLEMVARLYHLPRGTGRRRADELLERLGLAEVADRQARTFSGGMRRRLDLAASLIACPPVLFLDEPTTGLDPQSRTDVWAMLSELVTNGTTLILTTQYLEEVDRTADQVIVLGRGLVVAQGSPAALKARVGGDRLAVTLDSAQPLDAAAAALAPFANGPITTDRERPQLNLPVVTGTRLVAVVRALDAAGVDAIDVHRREATLDDVFLTLTRTPGPAHPKTQEAGIP